MPPITYRHSGFTLLELMISITLFTMLLGLGYQSMINLAYSQKAIERHTESQKARALSHRTLRQLIDSSAVLSGTSNTITFSFEQADTATRLNQTRHLIYISEQGLISKEPAHEEVTLMTELASASFDYYKGGEKVSVWNRSSRPDLVELSWIENDSRRSWLFSKAP